MCRAADILHPHLFDCPAAVGERVSCAHGDVAQVPSNVDCVGSCGRERIEFIVNNDNRLERIHLLEVQNVHRGEDVTARLPGLALKDSASGW